MKCSSVFSQLSLVHCKIWRGQSTSILKLFHESQAFCQQTSTSKILAKISTLHLDRCLGKIDQGKKLLLEVQEKLEECQMQLKEYFDESKNGVKIIQSSDEFKLALLPMAELSSDLFVETELLKMWVDFFGSDLPYFTYRKRLFTSQTFKTWKCPQQTLFQFEGWSRTTVLDGQRSMP